jgi:hypothetical protein
MRRIDQGVIWQRQQLLVQGIVKHSRQLISRHADRRQEVGPPNIANEERVAGQHRMRILGILL